MEVIRGTPTGEMMFADDIVMCGNTNVVVKTEAWRRVM
jgi:hypothetical protein